MVCGLGLLPRRPLALSLTELLLISELEEAAPPLCLPFGLLGEAPFLPLPLAALLEDLLFLRIISKEI